MTCRKRVRKNIRVRSFFFVVPLVSRTTVFGGIARMNGRKYGNEAHFSSWLCLFCSFLSHSFDRRRRRSSSSLSVAAHVHFNVFSLYIFFILSVFLHVGRFLFYSFNFPLFCRFWYEHMITLATANRCSFVASSLFSYAKRIDSCFYLLITEVNGVMKIC